MRCSPVSLLRVFGALSHGMISEVLLSIHHRLQIHCIVRLDETRLDAVRGLIELRGFRPSASKDRACQSDVTTSEKDKQICFVLMPAKDLIQYGRIWIRVASLSLVSLRHCRFLQWGNLYPISMYIIFSRAKIISFRFLSSKRPAGVFVFGGEI